MTEQISPEAMTIALLKEIQQSMRTVSDDIRGVKSELEIIRKGQEKNTVHLKYEIDLSVAHTNEEIADFTKMGVEINSLTVLPVPSAISLKLRGVTDEIIDLVAKERISISNHLIDHLLITNDAGSGVAKIHVFGKRTEV